MFVKSTPEVNFIIHLRAAFTRAIPKVVKKGTVDFDFELFALKSDLLLY